MATAEYFNLSGNSFTNVQEGTALYDMVHRMTNWGKREVIQWSKTNGGGKFTTIPDEMFVFKNLVQLDLSYNPGLTGEKNCSTHATSDVIFSGLPKMDGCSSLSDLTLQSCNKLTAEGLAEFCAHSPPALQKLNLSYTNLESKLLTVSYITHSTPNKIA